MKEAVELYLFHVRTVPKEQYPQGANPDAYVFMVRSLAKFNDGTEIKGNDIYIQSDDPAFNSLSKEEVKFNIEKGGFRWSPDLELDVPMLIGCFGKEDGFKRIAQALIESMSHEEKLEAILQITRILKGAPES